MDIQPQVVQPISDDQDLAKVLAGVDQQTDEMLAVPMASAPEQPAEPALPEPVFPDLATNSDNLQGVKKQALGELKPILDKLNLPPEEKFDIYLLVIRATDDTSLVPPAHEIAIQILDDTRRAQALYEIVKEVDYLAPEQAAHDQ